MRVIENGTEQAYEVGLFEYSGWKDTMKIRLLELPLVFGNLGADAGLLEIWDDYGEVRRCTFDLDALLFFDLDTDDPLELLCGPAAALKTLIYESRRFRGYWETDKIEA